jgi:23S rRNA pseudouridine1911/1915/1917 synthase
MPPTMVAARRIAFEVAPAEAGMRLDQVLARRVPGLSRGAARVLLDIGGVFVDRSRVKVASRGVRPGQRIEAHLGGALERARGARRPAVAPREEELRIAYEDDDLVVVDKQAGLLTAPTPESDRHNLLDRLRRRDPAGEVFLVHRIDLQTSGLVVLAKTAQANRALAERFRRHDVEREYLAVVRGGSEFAQRTIDAPITGRRAVTHLRVVERFGTRATLLEARLETGRTHQIRIHCAASGLPVAGDRRYGRAMLCDPPRIALHARRLGFAHPRSGVALDLTSPLPQDLAGWLERLRQEEDL